MGTAPAYGPTGQAVVQSQLPRLFYEICRAFKPAKPEATSISGIEAGGSDWDR